MMIMMMMMMMIIIIIITIIIIIFRIIIIIIIIIIICGFGIRFHSALQAGRSLVRFRLVSLEFFSDIILPAALWPWG